MFEDDTSGLLPSSKTQIVTVGDDLYGVSVKELEQRIKILKAEIERTEQALAKKSAELSEAEAFFKPKS